jgi:hypothetical protein
MNSGATPRDCAALCCGDCACISFALIVDRSPIAKSAPRAPVPRQCPASGKCCVLKDEVDALVPKTAAYKDTTTGVRNKFPTQDPPFPRSTRAYNFYFLN